MLDKDYIYDTLSEIMINLSFSSCRRILVYARELEKIEKAKKKGTEWIDDGILRQLLSEHISPSIN